MRENSTSMDYVSFQLLLNIKQNTSTRIVKVNNNKTIADKPSKSIVKNDNEKARSDLHNPN
jgi:hypothetical protein